LEKKEEVKGIDQKVIRSEGKKPRMLEGFSEAVQEKKEKEYKRRE